MKHVRKGIGLAVVAVAGSAAQAGLWLNEVLLNPAGGDAPFEYVEVRGTPNSVLAVGTYLVALEGDAGGNPGVIQNLFDLSGRHVGGNGFLVLLQQGAPYAVAPAAQVLRQGGAATGWGSGDSSTVGHTGEDGQTDIENPSLTLMLIEAPVLPVVGEDLDLDDDGRLDGPVGEFWRVLDAIAILDADGAGDIAYGPLAFRRNAPPGDAALVRGTVVPIDFTPGYVGRRGNTTGSAPEAWVASDHPVGDALPWRVGEPGSTFPAEAAGWLLDHLGHPNFGAPELPGIVLDAGDGEVQVSEEGAVGSYRLWLNKPPVGMLRVRIECPDPLEASLDGGLSFHPELELALVDPHPVEILVRARDDRIVDTSPYHRFIRHRLLATDDPVAYPPDTILPGVRVAVRENDGLVLSEINVNPPGEDDAGFEFVELRGESGVGLTNVYLLALDGSAGRDPGTVDYRLDLSGAQLGENGLLLVAAPGPEFVPDARTVVVEDAQLASPGGAFGNDALTVMLISSPVDVPLGEDLDKGDNGILEGLPAGATILDAVGWKGGDKEDLVFGDAEVELEGATPDAVARFPGNDHPNDPEAWFGGELAGEKGVAVAFDPDRVSASFRPGTELTPGRINNTAPIIAGWEPVSGVIGDPTNPPLAFAVDDAESGAGSVAVSVHSDNPAVVSDDHLTLLSTSMGAFRLDADPTGVGYATIVIRASDGAMTGEARVPYAASAMGRPGGRWLLGASDASSAIPIDGGWMWVADDEDEILRLYPRDRSALPEKRIDFTPFLDLTDIEDGDFREVDLEASVRVGRRLFWLGSHSHANIGETRTNRTRLFATDLTGTGSESTLTYVGRYDFLKQDLIEWDHQGWHGKGPDYLGLADSDAEGVPPKAEDGSGWSIEGLAMMPGSDTGAYVGFRAPIVPPSGRDLALMVPVLNFTALAVSDGPPGSAVFGAPVELDLYGRGIRSLAGDAEGYLIIAGPAAATPGPYPRDFRLYQWSGHPADLPEMLSADLSGLNPEAIVELPPRPWTSTSVAPLISDNGQTIYYGDDTVAKWLPIDNFKKSRSDQVALGEVTPPAPVILHSTVDDRGIELTWRTLPGQRYVVEQRASVVGAGWEMAAPVGRAEASRMTAMLNPPLATPAFYRVTLLPEN
ncbi:MAG: DUF3616 domain-containing protein [Verrucomicrobiales bacterium]|nr:DUF3616 domain-containing protein [Verrucomicrobiales bacterium]